MDDWRPEPQPEGSLQPPRRNPPTAVGVATPPPPPRRRRSAYRANRLQRIARIGATTLVATALGLAAGMTLPIALLARLGAGLTFLHIFVRLRRQSVFAPRAAEQSTKRAA